MSEAKQRPKRRPAKGPGGRPSKYDPAFCEALIEHMSSGLSVGGAAGKFGVARCTIYQWAEDHPEFSDALKVGQARAQLFWEAALIGAHKAGAPVTGAIFALKNRGRDDWTDTSRHEVTGKDGGAIKVDAEQSAIATLTAELARLASRAPTGGDSREDDSGPEGGTGV